MTNILIVEDETVARYTLRTYLEETFPSIKTAENFQEALQLIHQEHFDIIITDLMLPDKNGLDLLQEVAKKSSTSKVIIITAQPDVSSATQAMRSAAFDYLSKPIDKDTLIRTVNRALEVIKLSAERAHLFEENLRYRKELEQLVEIRTQSLKKREQTFRLMFENNPMPMIIYDLNSLEILDVNHAALLLYGYAREELLKHSVTMLFQNAAQVPRYPPDSQEAPLIQSSREVINRTKNGQKIYVEIMSHHFLYEDLPACYIMIKDISERKRTEQALIKSERKYRLLFENMAQGVFYLNAEGRIFSINKAALNILGLKTSQTDLHIDLLKNFRIYDAQGNALTWENFPPLKALQSQKPALHQIIRLRSARGKDIWLIMDSVPHLEKRNAVEVFTTFSDITQLKKAESDLRDSEQKLRAVLNAIPDQLFLFSRDGHCLDAKTDRLQPDAPNQFIGKTVFEIFPAPLAQRFQTMILLTNRTEQVQTFEYQHETGGKLRDFEARLVQSTAGQILCLIRDITERKRYESDLQKSESKFRILLESASQAIVLVNVHGRITLVNSQTEHLFGYSREELLHQPIEILLPYVERGKNNVLNQNNFRHLTTDIPKGTHELIGMRKDGSEFPFEIRFSQVEMFEGPFIMALITDISARKKLESRLRRVEKLEAIGQLAGGIAHDFNNVLAGIIGLSELSLRRIEKEDPVYENIKLIIKKSESAADLVRKLLMFSRQQHIAKHLLNLNQIVLSNQKLLQRYLGEDIRLMVHLADDLHLIHGDASAMDQMITNLCINARDAMPDGGELILQTRNITIKEKEKDLPPGEYVLFIISDTGVGMSQEVQKHIFEPFFTTKELGQGTGLGLATVYGLVQQHDGFIQFSSKLGEGTVFKIYFPAVLEDRNYTTRHSGQTAIKGGHETILLVDDQIDILSTSKETLESYGYKVLIAGNGIQALEIFEKYHDIIDLVISDVVMPDMDGIELRLFCQKIKPHIKFLLMSAFSPKLENENGYLLKPFLGSQLARKVREILDS